MNVSRVSVVILNWNTRQLLEEFLPQVIRNTQFSGVEIVVADNGSTDDSVEWVRDNHPEVIVFELGSNLGFADGYNKALSMLDSDYVVLLNSDVAPGENWIPYLITSMQQNENIAACVPAIKNVRQPDHYEYAGAAGGFIDSLGYTFCRGRMFDSAEKDLGHYKQSDSIFWGSGAALMVNRSLFLETGGLDARFFAHMEEVDWCWRIKNMGYQIRFVPQSEVFHLGGGTLGYHHPNKTYLNFRNNLYMMLKNLHKRALFYISLRLLMDWLAFVHFLVKGQGRNAIAILRAHRAFFKNCSQFYQNNKQLKLQVKTIDHPEVYPRSIVLDYFILRKKSFRELSFLKKVN